MDGYQLGSNFESLQQELFDQVLLSRITAFIELF